MERVQKAASSFSAIGDIPVTFFSTKGEILWECSEEDKVCKHFNVYNEKDGVCLTNLLASARIAAQLGKPYVFTCRAGLTNIAFSIISDKKVAGCLVAGPFLMGELMESIFAGIISINGLGADSYSKVLMALKNMKTFSAEHVSFLADLFGCCILGALTPNPDYIKISEHHQEMQKIAGSLLKHRAEPVVAQAGIVNDAILFTHANFKEKISLRDIAKKLHVSSSYLSMLFKQETGVTLTEYINLVRIGKSREMLSETSMSLVEISSACGFFDQSYFSKVFKKNTGVTPKEYRSIAKESQVVYHYIKETGR